MCGLIGILATYDPEACADLSGFAGALAQLRAFDTNQDPAPLEAVHRDLAPAAALLCAWSGFRALWTSAAARSDAAHIAHRLSECADAIERRLADGRETTAIVERLARARDAAAELAWRLERNALENLTKVEELLGGSAPPKLVFELWRLNLTFNQLERLEVRGRDSSGLGTLVHLSPADFETFEAEVARQGLEPELTRRRAIGDFRDGAILVTESARGFALAFAHKVAREVGELGANVRELRGHARADRLFRLALGLDGSRVQTIAHTRWASNGIVNEANAHPLTNEVEGGIASCSLEGERSRLTLPRVVLGALNGDIDNYSELASHHARETGRPISQAITTDAKLVALETDRRQQNEAAGSFESAFAQALGVFEGSAAIAAIGSSAPGTYALGLRGSGQAIYVGPIPGGGAIFASELYGLVELTPRYWKLAGEPGEALFLDEVADEPEARIRRADGSEVPLGSRDVRLASVTTRDIDRRGFEHYLIKEISESPHSVRKTLRGKFTLDQDERVHFQLGEDAIPAAVRSALRAGTIRCVYVIGQGTACVAARATADLLASLIEERGVTVRGMAATELSGFCADRLGPTTLVVAISQSGTTADTNRTVDVARQSGAHVLAIVNRRGSDLVDKSHGVLYTSDGRDVEMSVASTKAFFGQVVGGYVLSLALAEACGLFDPGEDGRVGPRTLEAVRLLRELSDLPRRMEEVLETARDRIRVAAQLALPRRHWAVVGSGPLRHAAEEVRIKLSELCYKSVAVDSIEDKKHIDLSSEPLVFVCAAGLSGASAADAVKEVAILRAHRAAPVVVCNRGDARFSEYALATIEVPSASPRVALLLNALAGHLFGYECARAIDALGAPLRRAREATDAALGELRGREHDALAPFPLLATRGRYRSALDPAAREALEACSRGRWNCAVDPDLAVRVSNALRLALGELSLDAPVAPSPTEASRARPSFEGLLEHALEKLTEAIDCLRRPIDAIKHQAKTVTVGISRDAPLARPVRGALARALADAGVDVHRLAAADHAALAGLSPAIASVQGTTIYAVSGLDSLGAPTASSRIQVLRKIGIASAIRSRADHGCALVGTKRRILGSPRVHVYRGERDGRTLVLCPFYERGIVCGLALLHVEFVRVLATRERVQALRAAGRHEDLRCAVTELDVAWEDTLLDGLPTDELLTAPIEPLAAAVVKVATARPESSRSAAGGRRGSRNGSAHG